MQMNKEYKLVWRDSKNNEILVKIHSDWFEMPGFGCDRKRLIEIKEAIEDALKDDSNTQAVL